MATRKSVTRPEVVKASLDVARAGPKFHRAIFWAMGKGWKAEI